MLLLQLKTGITPGICVTSCIDSKTTKIREQGNETGGKNKREKWRGDKGNEGRIYETKDKYK